MSDQTAAANLEITSALAEEAEEILRDFAENAELDIALVVDHSGALIAGISADDEVNVETVGALVAGTIGAIRALGKAVGESKTLESMHHGEETTIYLRELNERFIVVGAAESSLPAGIIREVGSRIAKPLLALLLGEEIVEKSEVEEVNFQDAPLDTVKEPIELTDTSAPNHKLPDGDNQSQDKETADEKQTAIPPLVVDSPFEFVDDNDDIDENGAEEEEEGIAADGIVFEIGIDEDAVPKEADTESDNDEVFHLGDGDETGVAAPLLVSPMIPKPEQIKIAIEDDEPTTSVAAITTPIATDIVKKNQVSDPLTENRTSTESENSVSEEIVDENQDSDPEDDQPAGGPRYVFEIG